MLEKALQDLELANPALAFIIKNPRGWPKAEKRFTQKRKMQLLSQKQRDIAQYFGFQPGDEKLLRKVPSINFTRSYLLYLQGLFKEPRIRAIFRKVTKITDYLFTFVICAREDGMLDLITDKLWKELGSELVGDLVPLRPSIDSRHSAETIIYNYPRILYCDWRDVMRYALNCKINSIEAISTKHEKMVASAKKTKPYINSRYPKHPFAEADFFQQIKTSHQLFKEGQNLNNCIFTYDSLAKQSVFYLFRMKNPEYCHFCIEKYWDEQEEKYDYCLVDFRNKDNRIPCDQAWDTLLEWLKANDIFGSRETIIYLPEEQDELIEFEEIDALFE